MWFDSICTRTAFAYVRAKMCVSKCGSSNMTSAILWFTTSSAVWNHQQYNDRMTDVTDLRLSTSLPSLNPMQRECIEGKLRQYDKMHENMVWLMHLDKSGNRDWLKHICSAPWWIAWWSETDLTALDVLQCTCVLYCCIVSKVGVQECLKNFCSLLLCSLLYSLKCWISRSFQHNESHWPNLSLKGDQGVLKHEVSRNTMFSELDSIGVKSEHMITTLLGWQKKI